jgi:Protein ENHANCED DISEASE RESISTANCE 2, C-terminal
LLDCSICYYRSTVGGKPALVGTKIKQVYHRGDGYFEIETDICSSTAALYILGVVKVSSNNTVYTNTLNNLSAHYNALFVSMRVLVCTDEWSLVHSSKHVYWLRQVPH